ncbi:MAG: hypothetical protein AB8B80_11810 [Marinicellaceae bacterium]
MNKLKYSLLLCGSVLCATSWAGIEDDIFSSNFQFDSKIAFTSFEEPIDIPFNGRYFDEQPCTAHDLVNNPDQPFVDTTNIGLTTEFGFSASFIPPTNCGGEFDDGVNNDFLGITSFALNLTDIDDMDQGGFSDGVRGYQISDPDGTYVMISEEIDLRGRVNNSVSIDYFLDDRNHFETPPDAGDWEPDDSFKIYVIDVTNAVDIDVVDLTGGVGGIDTMGIEYSWQSGVVMLPDNVVVRIVIEFTANSGREVVYIDNVEVRGTD